MYLDAAIGVVVCLPLLIAKRPILMRLDQRQVGLNDVAGAIGLCALAVMISFCSKSPATEIALACCFVALRWVFVRSSEECRRLSA